MWSPHCPQPLSSLWKVTRSMTSEISSVAGLRSGITAFMRGSFPTDGLLCVTYGKASYIGLAVRRVRVGHGRTSRTSQTELHV